MSKIIRKSSPMFGSGAGGSEIAQFGSLFASAPSFSTDPDVIQALSNWLDGWFQAVEGVNSPAIEDMNAFCYVMSYQISYLMQTGIPEWNSTTIYFIGSFAQDGLGNLYVSKTNSNTNHALTDASNWRPYSSSPLTKTVDNAASPYTALLADSGSNILVDATAGNVLIDLPNPSTVPNGYGFSFLDKLGQFVPGGRNVQLVPFGAELIMGLAGTYIYDSTWGSGTIFTDNTNWYIK